MKKMFLALALLTSGSMFAETHVKALVYLNDEILCEEAFTLEEGCNQVALGCDVGEAVVRLQPSDEQVTISLTANHINERGEMNCVGEDERTVAWGEEASFECEGAPARLVLVATRG